MQSKQFLYDALRAKYPEFIYASHHYSLDQEGLHLAYEFRMGEYVFRPQLHLPPRSFYRFQHRIRDHRLLADLVFHIGMIELISYWKTTCSPTIVIKGYCLNQEQRHFWRHIYFQGLGEFFYTNGISANADDFVRIKSHSRRNTAPFLDDILHTAGTIIPVGGGKDSAVTLELLKSKTENNIPMIINPRSATLDCLRVAGYDESSAAIVYRTIDPLLLKLNEAGFLNGHTPFSAVIAFVSALVSFLTGVQNVALSNENSANESTVKGTEINHQYSKTLSFENDFRAYVRTFLLKQHNYFSFLRPIDEWQIAALFAQYSAYFPVFKSCNSGSKTDTWCHRCPKCLFTYIILSPYISEEVLSKAIFEHNLLDDPQLESVFDQLTGKLPIKPFECVGTVSEVNRALATYAQQQDGKQLPYLLRKWQASEEGIRAARAINRSIKEIKFAKHNLSDAYKSRLFPFARSPFAVQVEKEWQDKQILLLGFGKEGQSTYRFLREIFPRKNLFIAADHFDDTSAAILSADRHCVSMVSEGMLKILNTFDVVIKSPGVPSKTLDPYLIDKTKITSQTDIFLRFFSRQSVGITGTKGKTTTSQLLYQMLLTKTKNVLLAGNGGTPVFDILPQINPSTVIVLELSSHQLEHLTTAPAYSMVLNIFQEHLDHYTSYAAYQTAKMNIAAKQTAQDLFWYNADDETVKAKLAELKNENKRCELHLEQYRWKQPAHLQGDHNRLNVLFAATVAHIFGVSDRKIGGVLKNFRPLEHRLTCVGTFRNITFYNDSISTIPEATIAAIGALRNVSTLILGGFDRGVDYIHLVDFLCASNVRNIVFVGEAGRRIRDLLPSNHPFHIYEENAMEKIVAWCYAHTLSGTICLLSPAASSYDQYQNFEHRGRTYQEAVENIADENHA